MNRTKWITITAATALTASLAFAAPHQEGRAGRHNRGPRPAMSLRMAERLNLSDAQREQIRTLQSGFREKSKPLFETFRATRRELRLARRAEDDARLEQLAPAVERQRAQLRQLRKAHRQQVLAVLTPEQRTQFEALKAERAGRCGQRGRGTGW